MSTTLSATLSLTDFQAVPAAAARRAPSSSERLQAWLAGKSRARMVAAERAALARHAPAGRGDVLSLDCPNATTAGRLARLATAPDGSVDTVISVGALADATDVGAMLAEVKRVLRPGGRLLFVEPVAAPAGTRLRKAQRTMDRLWRVLSGSVTAPRDLWNDLKAARFAALDLNQVSLPGLAGLPVPHLVGEARLPAAPRAASERPRARGAGAPVLAWSVPAFAFFG